MVRNPSANREQFRPHDHPNDAFLLTTVVGSYPKPKWLNRADELVDDPDSKFDVSDLEEAHDDACRLITHEHERAGLDTVVDGEMRRNEMVEFFADRIDGYEFNGPVKVWGHNYFDKPSVVEEVEYDEPWLVDEFEFTSSVAEHPVKVPITGPYTLGFWAFNEAYPSTEELVYDLADLVNEEVEKLVEAGARYIQIDEPALATTPEDHAIVGEALERIVSGIDEEVRIGLHVCYGDYSRIYPRSTTTRSTSSTWSCVTATSSRFPRSPTPSSSPTSRSASSTPTRRRSSQSRRSKRTSGRACASSRRRSSRSRPTAG